MLAVVTSPAVMVWPLARMMTSNWLLPAAAVGDLGGQVDQPPVLVAIADLVRGIELLLRVVDHLPGHGPGGPGPAVDHGDGRLLHQQEAAEHQHQDRSRENGQYHPQR
jgi:hypothetical protein